jgi:hypothetical protein
VVGEPVPIDIAARRLRSQRLVGNGLDGPADVVRWLGAVQSQDYPGAKWALAQRTDGWDNAALDQAFDAGAMLRTHVLRPTWHFVTPEDIRWLVALTGPRVDAGIAGRYRQLELDGATLHRADAVIVKALEGGRARTRQELGAELQAAGISPGGQRLPHLLSHAELLGLICSGPMRGKLHTFALLDERVPPDPAPAPGREEAVARLVRRYFASHGPATVHDFAWWSGLTVTDARRGLAAIREDVEAATVGDATYWTVDPGPADPGPAVARTPRPSVHLLPNYDEHLVAYRDHGPSQHPGAREGLTGRADLRLGPHAVVVDGLVVGGWRRSLAKGSAVVEAKLLVGLSEAERAGLQAAVERFGAFLGLPARLQGA